MIKFIATSIFFLSCTAPLASASENNSNLTDEKYSSITFFSQLGTDAIKNISDEIGFEETEALTTLLDLTISIQSNQRLSTAFLDRTVEAYESICTSTFDPLLYVIEIGITDELLNMGRKNQLNGFLAGSRTAEIQSIEFDEYLSSPLRRQYATAEALNLIRLADEQIADALIEEIAPPSPNSKQEEDYLNTIRERGGSYYLSSNICMVSDAILGAMGYSETISFPIISAISEDIRRLRPIIWANQIEGEIRE